MRETNSRGKTEIYMPKDKQAAAHKLAELSALAASREWERAALVALMVTNKSKGGRPRKNSATSSGDQFTVTEFIRIGIYGFRSHAAVDAYLRAWAVSGLPQPVFGQKIELPADEFPEYAELYGRTGDDAAELEDGGEADDTEDADNEEEGTDDSPQPRPHPERTMLDQFLKVLDQMDPTAVVHGQSPQQVELFIKTLESWLDSAREAAAEIMEDDAALYGVDGTAPDGVGFRT